MLKDEPIEYIKQQYDEKNNILGAFGEQVNAITLYEDIFGDTEQEIPVVIIDDDTEKRIRVMSVDDAIALGECRNDILIGGCTYFNNWISKKSCKNVHSLIIDYDNAYSGVLLQALQNGWRSANNEPFAMPTYIVNSGTGLHLYFVFDEPIPNYHTVTSNFDKLYRALALQQSRRVYVQPQIQWFGQDFRCGGGLNKYGWENTIYKVGDKWDIDNLAKMVGLNDLHFIRYGEKRTQKPQAKKHRKKVISGWKTNRAFYDYALKNCREKTHEGNRYMSMCSLSAIAYKCGVPIEELEEDLKGLLPVYNKNANRIVKEKEIASAMKMYNDRAISTPRSSLEHWQGWEYKPQIKRNGLKQSQHLTVARTIKQAKKTMGIMKQEGRPTAQETVTTWRTENPNGTKAQCIKDTGLSKPTVYKWW